MKSSTTFAPARFIINGLAPCSKCGMQKPVTDFSKSSTSAIGLKSHCKKCVSDALAANKTPELVAKSKAYYLANKEQRKAYNTANKERISLQRKAFRDSRTPEQKQLDAAKGSRYSKQVAINNMQARLMSNLTTRMNRALDLRISRAAARSLLGCNAKELKEHLESQFKNGMTWDNYGRRNGDLSGWEMDHILPCRIFDFTKQEDRERCFHHSNVQPLWSKDNCRKNAIT